MLQQTPEKRVLFVRRAIPVLLAIFGVFSFALTIAVSNFGRLPQTAYAAASSTINFQARLQTAAGGIVPDGDYNVEFKLYDSSAAGTADQGTCSGDSHCLWVETRTGGNKVTVTNGYLSVQLGSVTAFGGSIDWSQQLWMTMNIGGTGTASWDGEMNPSLPLTAVPYAFQAGHAATADQLSKTNGGYTSTLGIQSPTGGNQTFQIQNQGAAGTYNILTAPDGSDGYIKLQGGSPSVQTGNIAVDGSIAGGTLSLQPASNSDDTLVVANSDASVQVLAVDTDAEKVVTARLEVQSGYDINIVSGALKSNGTTIINSSGKLQNAGFDSGTNYSNLQVVTDLTATGSITIGDTTAGGLLTNNGATLNTAKSLGNITGASIGTAADTVDAFTSFTITQTTSSITASIPSPTDTTAGRVIYVANLGTSSQSITVGNVLLSPGNSSTFFWNGSTWAATAVSTGVSVVGSFSNSGINDGASISGNTLTFGSADATHPGMVNTTTQTFQGAKTFSSLLTGSAGLTVSGGAVSLTGNTTSSITTSSGALTLTSAAAATWGTNSGALTLQGTDGVTIGSTNSAISIDSGTGTIGVGTGAQARSINIGTGAAAQTVTIGSTNSTSSLALLAGSGNINIGSVGSSTASSTIHIGDTTDATGSQTVVVGSSAANSSNATIIKGGSGSSAGSEAIRILTANAGAIAIGGSSQTGSITLGQSSATNTIYMGSAIGNGNTQTILIGNNTFGTGVTNVTVGSLIGASGTTVYSGSGSITLQTNGGTSATTGTIVKSSTNNSTGAFQVQNASSVAIFNVDTTNSTITIGSGTSTYTFSSTGLLIGSGAQHTKYITLTAEYAGAVLDAAGDSSCSSANSGTLTSGYVGNPTFQNYYKWVSGNTAQCYDVVVRVPLPADFAGWASSTPLTVQTYSSAHSTGLINVDVHDTAGGSSSVTGCSYVSATPGSDSTWTSSGSNCNLSTGTYTAGGVITLRLRLTGNASNDVRVGDITLAYKSQF